MGITLVLALGAGLPVYYRIFFFTFLLLGITFVWNRVNLFGVSITGRRDLTKIKVGRNIESEIVVENYSPFPKFNLQVRDLIELPGHNCGEMVNLMPFSKRIVNLEIPVRRRGVYQIGQPSVSSGDPLGVFQIYKKNTSREKVLVFPYTVDVHPFLLSSGDMNAEGSNLVGINSSVSSVSTIREYQAGESAKHIHWPTTARKDGLMIKQFDSDSEDVTWVLLDIDTKFLVGDNIDNTEEYSVMIAASLVKTYSNNNKGLGLIAGGHVKYLIRPEEENRDPDNMLFALTEVSGSDNFSLIDLFNYFKSEVSLSNVSLIIITSSTNSEWVESISSSKVQGCSPVVIFVDPVSFGSEFGVRPLANQLAMNGIPVYLAKYGDDLSDSLSHIWMIKNEEPIQTDDVV